MQIHQLVVWDDYCRRDSQAESKLFAHPSAGASIIDRMGNVCVAVGPEGGFTDDEVGVARSAGWRLVSLGPRVLRVETAALALATLLAVKL